MTQGYKFYKERADASAAEAQAATLDNVKERALRAEATWRGLARQARDVADQRAEIESRKAAERASLAD